MSRPDRAAGRFAQRYQRPLAMGSAGVMAARELSTCRRENQIYDFRDRNPGPVVSPNLYELYDEGGFNSWRK